MARSRRMLTDQFDALHERLNAVIKQLAQTDGIAERQKLVKTMELILAGTDLLIHGLLCK